MDALEHTALIPTPKRRLVRRDVANTVLAVAAGILGLLAVGVAVWGFTLI